MNRCDWCMAAVPEGSGVEVLSRYVADMYDPREPTGRRHLWESETTEWFCTREHYDRASRERSNIKLTGN